jgi:hypothetical protein
MSAFKLENEMTTALNKIFSGKAGKKSPMIRVRVIAQCDEVFEKCKEL